MTIETWNTFLDVMKKDKNTVVLDLTKKDQAYADKEKISPMTEEEEYKNAGFVKGTK